MFSRIPNALFYPENVCKFPLQWNSAKGEIVAADIFTQYEKCNKLFSKDLIGLTPLKPEISHQFKLVSKYFMNFSVFHFLRKTNAPIEVTISEKVCP